MQVARLVLLEPNALVEGCPLRCSGLRARVCIARQVDGDRPPPDPSRPESLSRHDGKRGTAPMDGCCSTAQCEVGRRIREALGDACASEVRRGWKAS